MKLKLLGKFSKIKEALRKGKVTNSEALFLYESLVLSIILDFVGGKCSK